MDITTELSIDAFFKQLWICYDDEKQIRSFFIDIIDEDWKQIKELQDQVDSLECDYNDLENIKDETIEELRDKNRDLEKENEELKRERDELKNKTIV